MQCFRHFNTLEQGTNNTHNQLKEEITYISGLQRDLQHSKKVYLGWLVTYISQFHSVKIIRKQRAGFQIQRPQ